MAIEKHWKDKKAIDEEEKKWDWITRSQLYSETVMRLNREQVEFFLILCPVHMCTGIFKTATFLKTHSSFSVFVVRPEIWCMALECVPPVSFV